MKVIIAGSRTISSYEEVKKAVSDSGFNITEVVSGHANGIDKLGEQWAKENNIPVKVFIPDWKSLGRSAGIQRNVEMGNYADALIAIWDTKSRGTKHMINFMSSKPTYVRKCPPSTTT